MGKSGVRRFLLLAQLVRMCGVVKQHLVTQLEHRCAREQISVLWTPPGSFDLSMVERVWGCLKHCCRHGKCASITDPRKRVATACQCLRADTFAALERRYAHECEEECVSGEQREGGWDDSTDMRAVALSMLQDQLQAEQQQQEQQQQQQQQQAEQQDEEEEEMQPAQQAGVMRHVEGLGWMCLVCGQFNMDGPWCVGLCRVGGIC